MSKLMRGLSSGFLTPNLGPSFHIMFFGQLHPALPFVLVVMLTIKSLIVLWQFLRAWYSELMALPSIQWCRLTHDSQLAKWHLKLLYKIMKLSRREKQQQLGKKRLSSDYQEEVRNSKASRAEREAEQRKSIHVSHPRVMPS